MNRRPKLAIQESKEVCSQLKKDVANILELANSLADDFKESGPEYRNSLNEMEHSVAELARVEFEVGHMDRALENVEQELAASDSQEQEPRNFGDEYEERLAAVKRCAAAFDPRLAPSVVAFRARVGGATGDASGERSDGEEELVMGGVKRSLVCPLTKKQMEEPVRSRKCGHSYSKAAILEHIARRRDAKCPVCGQLIREEELESDGVLIKLLKKEKRKQKLKTREGVVQL
ncbi:hypothetical protein EMCRGX_G014301 [Ephydatia muelleri]